MGIKWRSQKKQAQDDFIRLIIGMYLYRTLSLKYGDRPHEISDGFYFNDIFLVDLEKYIRLHETDDLSALMERFYPVILGNNKKLEIWIDQTLASIDKEADKVILYLENMTNLKLNSQTSKTAIGTWLKILALQPELKSRTSHFSLYNVAVVYAATRKLSDKKWSFRPSYCRKIELQNPSAFKQQVVTLLRELYSAQDEQNPDTTLTLKCLNSANVAPALSDIAYQVILDAREAQRAIRNDTSVVPTISVKIPLNEHIHTEDIRKSIPKASSASHRPVTKDDIRRAINRIERERIRRALEEKQALAEELNGQTARMRPSSNNRISANSVIAPIRIIKESSFACDEKCPENYTDNPDFRELLYLYDKSYRLDDFGDPDDSNDPEYIEDQYLEFDYDVWMDEREEREIQQALWEGGYDEE